MPDPILKQVEDGLMSLLNGLVSDGTLNSLEQYPVADENDIQDAVSRTSAKNPAGLLSQPVFQEVGEDDGLNEWELTYAFVASNADRGNRSERRTDTTKGTYKIFEEAYKKVRGKTIPIVGVTHSNTQPIFIGNAQFLSYPEMDVVFCEIRVTLRAETISDTYRP